MSVYAEGLMRKAFRQMKKTTKKLMSLKQMPKDEKEKNKNLLVECLLYKRLCITVYYPVPNNQPSRRYFYAYWFCKV